ncbi:hypothetical protein PR202_gb18201 [Eleusine coracana subsp. coracana]|uniref:Reverse transcriptase zinc-binding domain-containing protein n=1 Tax=Eleusine coracana subsp. coracana TaxID=191504 RepID=A0AAV5F6D4_ELECO|nr:hypothetical protein PR202_gb18201 [Eleusine coracana subsp. coracana]
MKTVAQVFTAGIEAGLQLRLSRVARQELEAVTAIMESTSLTDASDTRCNDLFCKDGTLSTAALYNLTMSATDPGCSFFTFIWKNRAPSKVQFFGWLMVQERVQCKANLLKKSIVDNDTCEVCANAREDTNHIFFQCSFACEFWRTIGVDPSNAFAAEPWNLAWPATTPLTHRSTFALLCFWQVWKHRNGVVFREEAPSLQQLVQRCRDEARAWRCRFKREDESVCNSCLYLLLWGKRQEALHCPPKDAENDKEQQLPVQI